MTAVQVIAQIKALPAADRAQVVEEAIRQLKPEERKPIERLLRRLQHPDIPESFWQGAEDHEDGRTVEMEAALREAPPAVE
jgi:hypothetical protein